ncbi:MAG: hypothetical protein Q8M29_12825 [Bacteroidota bacterium]|nr:hypothetical protein [Bacteroidota bacterium]
MKKKLFVFFSFVLLASLVFISCNTDEQDGLTVGFANESGTGGNPDNTSAGTTGGGTTSTTVGSTSTTGGPFLTTSGSTTSGSTTSGSTTSSTSGSTTAPPPTGNYFKVDNTVYTCTTVTGGIWNNSWSIIGRTAAGDTCYVGWTAIPAAGVYTLANDILNPGPTECVVAAYNNGSSLVYFPIDGGSTVQIINGTQRKVTITGMNTAELNSQTPHTLEVNLTTP